MALFHKLNLNSVFMFSQETCRALSWLQHQKAVRNHTKRQQYLHNLLLTTALVASVVGNDTFMDDYRDDGRQQRAINDE